MLRLGWLLVVVNIDFWFGMSFNVFSCELVSEVFSSVASEVVKSNVLAF